MVVVCRPLRAGQRRQRAQSHHRASIPPAIHSAGIVFQAVVPGNGVRSRWPHTASFCLGWGKWVDLCAVQRLLVRHGSKAAWVCGACGQAVAVRWRGFRCRNCAGASRPCLQQVAASLWWGNLMVRMAGSRGACRTLGGSAASRFHRHSLTAPDATRRQACRLPMCQPPRVVDNLDTCSCPCAACLASKVDLAMVSGAAWLHQRASLSIRNMAGQAQRRQWLDGFLLSCVFRNPRHLRRQDS